MNGAVVGNGGGQWLVRGAKIAVFDLPKDVEVEIDLSDAERTSKRPVLTPDSTLERAASTSEVDTNDILTAVPIDPTVPFEMRVPDKVHARAARLAAQLPKANELRSARALVDGRADGRADGKVDGDATPARPARSARSFWTFAAVFVAFAVVGTGAGFVVYQNAPIPSANAHTFKAAAAAKVLAQRTSENGGFTVPTVSVDSLPRARR